MELTTKLKLEVCGDVEEIEVITKPEGENSTQIITTLNGKALYNTNRMEFALADHRLAVCKALSSITTIISLT